MEIFFPQSDWADRTSSVQCRGARLSPDLDGASNDRKYEAIKQKGLYFLWLILPGFTGRVELIIQSLMASILGQGFLHFKQ